MKKLSVLFLSLVALTATVTSCSKSDTPAAPANTTALTLTIKDYTAGTGTAVTGAMVTLYGTQTDWQNGTNPIGTAKTSDATGNVTFTNLKAQIYYYSVSTANTAGCLSNDLVYTFTYDPANTTSVKPSAIVANKTTTLIVPVVGTTGVAFTNNDTTNDWQVTVSGDSNGALNGTYYNIPASTTTALTYPMPTGNYTISMQAVTIDPTTGVATPITTIPAQTFAQTLTCGTVGTVVVP